VSVTGSSDPPADAVSQDVTRARVAAALGPNYDLGERLGAGGFADVYAAFDRRLKRRVAVKVLHDELHRDDAFRERFRREAETVAQLRHPHIVPIFSVGEGDLAYCVMPLLEGETLAAALERKGRWAFPEVCRILRESASALREAHRCGLIHRDVKPENIMLEGPDQRVVLMDFGIAKAFNEEASPLTATGMVLGSPLYMSPEQAAGDPVAAATDQYSLALVGYRLLAGRLPFHAESMRALLFKQATEPPPALENVRPDTPGSLNTVIMRGLAKDPAQRFPSMREFEAALTSVASEVAGDFRRQRSVVPLEERWATTLSGIYDRPWRNPAVLVAGLLLFCYAFPRGESRAARQAMGARDVALVTARRTLDSTGVTTGHEAIAIGSNNGLYRFLQEALSGDAVDSAATDVGVWYWQVSRGQHDPDRYASATAGPDGRLWGLQRSDPGSVPGPQISADSAAILAMAAMRRAGYDSAALGSARMEAEDLGSRRDYRFVWSLPSRPTRWDQESVRGTLRVGLSGDRVTLVARDVSVPRPTSVEFGPAIISVISGLAVGVALVLFLFALWITAKRAAFDTIQWGTTFRLTILYVVVYTVAWVLPTAPVLSAPLLTAENASTIANHVAYAFGAPGLIGPAMMLLVLLAATESLLNETRPDLVAGLADVSRLRLRAPEVLGALLPGVASGVGLAALRAAASMAGRMWAHLPVESWTAVPDVALASRWPAIGILSEAGITVQVVTAVAFFVAVASWMHRPWLAPLAALIFCASLTIAQRSPNVVAWYAVLDGMLAGLTALIMMRHGVLAGMLALFLATAIPVVYDLIWAGGPFRAAGVEGLVMLLLPVVLAVDIYARRPRIGVPQPVSRAR
jgi:tRNA A-37 threonylcarbamoyl transferase component Bud32